MAVDQVDQVTLFTFFVEYLSDGWGIKLGIVALGSQLVRLRAVDMIRGWLLIYVVLCLGVGTWGFKLGADEDHSHEHEHEHDHSDVDHDEHQDLRDGKAEDLFSDLTTDLIRTENTGAAIDFSRCD